MPNPTPIDEDDVLARCTHCRRIMFANEQDRPVCFPCEDRARLQLKEMPGLYDQLGPLLIPGRKAKTGPTGKGKTAPLPVAVTPLDLRARGGIVTVLQAVEDSWRKARARTIATFAGDFQDTLADVVNFLTMNLNWACNDYPDVADDLDEIARVYRHAKNTVNGTQPLLIPVHCRFLFDDGKECGAPMKVDINRVSVKCSDCGQRWGQQEWMALFEATRSTAA